MKRLHFGGLATLLALAMLIVPAQAEKEEGSTTNPLLLDPTSEVMQAKAPDVFKAKFETSRGDIVIEVKREWAPRGADRFYNLVQNGYYNDCRFFRIIDNFMAQIGIHGDPAVSKVWRMARIKDDPVKKSNARGFLSFATGGPDTRTTQFFINFRDNSRLDGMGFSPFGKVIEGMEVVNELHSGYGECGPRGQGPEQGRAQQEGNAYIAKEFPKLDYVIKCWVLPPAEDVKDK